MRVPPTVRQSGLVLSLCLFMVLITRLPLMPQHLFSFDSVNFALALDQFDPSRHQPQPPGYPFFVGEARLVRALAGSPEITFTLIKLLISALALALVFLLGASMMSPGVGLLAAVLLLVNPTFWHSSLASVVRPHLAMFSALFAYLCWQAAHKDRRTLLAASAVLGISMGFRIELPVILFPLWVWTAWHVADRKLAIQGLSLIVAGVAAYCLALLTAANTIGNFWESFSRYVIEQTYQTSLLTGAEIIEWKRMVGRNLVWYGAGALGWIWAIPWGWRALADSPQSQLRLQFLAVWFCPAFLLSMLWHGAAPGHTLAGQVPLVLLGAISLCAAEAAIQRSWQPRWPLGAAAIASVIICSQLFFMDYQPNRPSPAAERPSALQGVIRPVRYGLYETSYRHVRWVDDMAGDAFAQIRALQAGTSRPVVVVWSREAEPVWRKVAYYFPDLYVYALEEAGDLAAPVTRATLWKGSKPLAVYDHGERVPVPIPANARIIWLLPGGAGTRLRQAVTLAAAPPLYYTDLDSSQRYFDWRSFRFVMTRDSVSRIQSFPKGSPGSSPSAF